MPVAFMMGIPYAESFTVAELIGTKLFLNEFVAYQKLSELKDNRLNGLAEIIGGERQWISVSACSLSAYGLGIFSICVCINSFIQNHAEKEGDCFTYCTITF